MCHEVLVCSDLWESLRHGVPVEQGQRLSLRSLGRTWASLKRVGVGTIVVVIKCIENHFQKTYANCVMCFCMPFDVWHILETCSINVHRAKVIPVVSPLDAEPPHLGGSEKKRQNVRKRISSSAAGCLTGRMAKRMCYGRGFLACKLPERVFKIEGLKTESKNRCVFLFFDQKSHPFTNLSGMFGDFQFCRDAC